MAAKPKTEKPKTTTKVAKPTTVTKPAKKSKPVVKTSKKKAPAKPKTERKPPFTQKMFEQRFYSLSQDEFKALCEIYVEKQLKFKIIKQPDYDHWLNYFKSFPASHIRLLVRIGQDMFDAEAFSALRMWHDIINNPQRIAKISQPTLRDNKGKNDNSIVAMALKNDRYGVLCATRDAIAIKLEKGAGARDTAALARELTEVMTQIADYEKRSGPKKDTKLGQLLNGMPGANTPSSGAKKRPGKNGGGARNTSYASRVTIKDIEDNNG